jgi:hypothetical protein
LVQQSERVAERVTNACASADRDVEGRLHSLAARAQEKRERFIDILNHDIGFRADMQVHDELCVGVRKSKADRFVASPQDAMPEAIAVEGDRGIKVGDAKQKVVELSKQRALGGHNMILAAGRALSKARSGALDGERGLGPGTR